MIRLYRVEAEHGLRAAVREQLHRVLGATELNIDDRGRPWLPGVSFNVSHSGSLGLIAVAEGERRIGVDLERVRPDIDFVALAARFFHPEEAAAIGDQEAFFRCWTRKEAVVKALGLGLGHPLTSFVVDVDGSGAAPVRGVEGLSVTGLEIQDGYMAALAGDDPLDFAWSDEQT